MQAAKENERCPNVFVHNFGIHRILLSEEDRKFPMSVNTESRSDKFMYERTNKIGRALRNTIMKFFCRRNVVSNRKCLYKV